jgi:succinoglycan biosynthesis transport protein ExoP
MSRMVTTPSEPELTTAAVRGTAGLNGGAAPLNVSPAFNEGFRLLALNVHRLLASSERRSIVVLSAKPREGRSTTAAALAKAMSRMPHPVVLIDADPDGSGLTDVVPSWKQEGGEDPRGTGPRLQVLNPWFPTGTPETFLSRVQDAIQDALDAGATVIIDAPACSISSAGFYLATDATGVLYVTRPSITQDGGVHGDVRAQLDLLGARVLGVVINEG